MRAPGALPLLHWLTVWSLAGSGVGVILFLAGSGVHLPGPLVPLVLLLAGLTGGLVFSGSWWIYRRIVLHRREPRRTLVMLLLGGLAGWLLAGAGLGVPRMYGGLFGLTVGTVCRWVPPGPSGDNGR